MKIGMRRFAVIFCFTTACLFAAAVVAAQLAPPGGLQNPQANAASQYDHLQEKQLGNPKAARAYKTFLKTKDPDKRIKLGKDFINRYPSDYRAQGVYEQLAQLYYAKQDFQDFNSCADRGIALYPDDATLLSLAGWVIPHRYNQNDPDRDKKLTKAELYENRALSAISTMKAPTGMSDAQFSAYKKQVSALAHGSLGLIYFRESKFTDSVTEMQTAAQDTSSPEATDYLVLGADYQNLGDLKKAADAFARCAQISGPLQAGCKQYAESSLKQAGQTK